MLGGERHCGEGMHPRTLAPLQHSAPPLHQDDFTILLEYFPSCYKRNKRSQASHSLFSAIHGGCSLRKRRLELDKKIQAEERATGGCCCFYWAVCLRDALFGPHKGNGKNRLTNF